MAVAGTFGGGLKGVVDTVGDTGGSLGSGVVGMVQDERSVLCTRANLPAGRSGVYQALSMSCYIHIPNSLRSCYVSSLLIPPLPRFDSLALNP